MHVCVFFWSDYWFVVNNTGCILGKYDGFHIFDDFVKRKCCMICEIFDTFFDVMPMWNHSVSVPLFGAGMSLPVAAMVLILLVVASLLVFWLYVKDEQLNPTKNICHQKWVTKVWCPLEYGLQKQPAGWRQTPANEFLIHSLVTFYYEWLIYIRLNITPSCNSTRGGCQSDANSD